MSDDHTEISQNNPPQPKKTLKERLIALLKYNSSPHEIAFGIGLGVFIGFLPLYGLHTFLVIMVMLIIPRANKIAIFLGTNVSLPPTLPFITWAAYKVGMFVLHNSYIPFNWGEMFHKHDYKGFLKIYYPLFVGSLILGIIAAVASYFFVYWFINRRRAAKTIK